MKEFINKLIERLEEITEPIRPVGWSLSRIQWGLEIGRKESSYINDGYK